MIMVSLITRFLYLPAETDVDYEQLIEGSEWCNFKSCIHKIFSFHNGNVLENVGHHMIGCENCVGEIRTFVRVFIKIILDVFVFCSAVVLNDFLLFVHLTNLANRLWRIWLFQILSRPL